MKAVKTVLICLLVAALALLLPESANAQCSLCKGAVESNMKGGGGLAQGLYNGILYLITIPYLVAAVIVFFWYRNSKKHKEKQTRVTSLLEKRLKGQI